MSSISLYIHFYTSSISRNAGLLFNNEDTIKCLFNIFVDGDTIYDVSLNEEIEFQIGDVITKPTDDELEFITSTLKKQGYFYNENSYKIERLN